MLWWQVKQLFPFGSFIDDSIAYLVSNTLPVSTEAVGRPSRPQVRLTPRTLRQLTMQCGRGATSTVRTVRGSLVLQETNGEEALFSLGKGKGEKEGGDSRNTSLTAMPTNEDSPSADSLSGVRQRRCLAAVGRWECSSRRVSPVVFGETSCWTRRRKENVWEKSCQRRKKER